MQSAYLNTFLGDCEDLLANLEQTAGELEEAISTDIVYKRLARDAGQDLSDAEAELIAEASIRAKVEKAGPLAGLAVSSPAYKAAVDDLVAKAHRGELASLWAASQQTSMAADDAHITREQLSVRYGATKRAADLRAAMLNALDA